MNVSQHRSPCETGEARDYIKRMALKMSDHDCSEEELIMVVDLLTKFVKKANTREMSEAMVLVALPSFLNEFAKSQYAAGAEMMSPEKEGI